MGKRKLLIVILAVIAMLSIVLAACVKYKPGSEVGVYYYDGADGEYTLTLDETAQFDFKVKGKTLSGKYKLEDGKLTLAVSNKGEDDITATYRNDEISLTYGSEAMKFIRKINYTVTFDSKGGSAVASQTVVNGRTASKPGDPTQAGHTFVGWFEDESCTNLYDFSAVVTHNLTLYAKWQVNSDGRVEHTVTFDGNFSGALKTTLTTVNGKILNAPPAPTQADHTFVDWFVSMYDDGAKLTRKFDITAEVTEDMVVYAAWSQSGHTDLGVSVTEKQITWNAANGVNSYTITVKSETGDIVKSDFVMTTIYSGVDFSALEAGNYVVEVSGTGIASSTVRYYRNKGLDKVKTFKVESGTLLVFNSVPNAEKYLITINCGNEDHNHTLYDNGNSTNYNFVNCQMQQDGISFVVTAVAEGYLPSVSEAYIHVNNLGEIGGIYYNPANETISWNAVTNATGYVVTFTGETTTREIYSDSASVSVKTLGKGQYTVSVVATAWGYNSSSASYSFTKNSDTATDAALTYSNGTVSWAPVAGVTEYVVRLNGDVIATTSNTSVAVSFGRSGSNEISVQFGSNQSTSVTVYVYEITFDARGGNLIDGAAIYVAKGDEISYPAPSLMVRDGYDFSGWYATPNGADDNGRRVTDKYFNGDSDVILYAFWKVAGMYLTYNYGEYSDGSVTDTEYKVYPNSNYTLAVPTTNDETVAFVGWYTDENGNGTRLTDENGASLAPWTGAHSIDVYAYWAQIFNYVEHGADYGVTKGPGINYVKSVKVPETYNGGKITIVEGMAFSSCLNLQSISIPNSVTAIETTAFDGCSHLINVEIYETGAIDVVYFDIDGVVFKNDEGVKSLIYFPFGRTGSYTLPAGISQLPTRCFAGSQLSEIVLNSDVTYVGMYAFYNCTRLVNVVFDNNSVLQIDDYAFQNCVSLTSITIPDGVEFSLNIFDGCSSLAAINANNSTYQSKGGMLVDGTTLVYAPKGISGTVSIPAGITAIGSYAFSGCSKLTGIVIPDFVTKIGDNAFSNCSALASVTINGASGSVTIGAYAFANNNNLTTVKVTNVNVNIGAYAFANCVRLSKVEFVNCTSDEIGDRAFYKDSGLAVVTLSSAKTIGAYAFADCISLASITLPSTVTTIGEYAFSGCTALATVTFDAVDVQEFVVKEHAFDGATKLTAISLPNGTATIEQYAFSASGLKEIILPNSIVEIGQYAFAYSVSLAYVKLPDSLETLSYRVFYGCTSLVKIGLGNSYQFDIRDFDGVPVTDFEFGEGSDYSTKNGLLYNADKTVLLGSFGTNESVEVVATVTRIEMDAFNGSQVKHVTFEANSVITEISDWAFAYATALETVVIPDSVTTIVQHAFIGCTSLISINLGNVTKVGQQAFMGASSLAEIDLSKVTNASNIGSRAFEGTTSLQRVTLSDELTTLPANTFSGCTSLATINLDNITNFGERALNDTAITTITFSANLSTIGNFAFEGTKLAAVDLSGTSIQSIGLYAFSKCAELVSVTLNDSLEKIDVGTFSQCVKLNDIDVSKVKTIDSSAFRSCTSLLQVDLSSVNSIGSSAFYDCSSLQTVKLADTMDTLYIGMSAFANCTSLSSFTFPSLNDEFEIEDATFRNCTSLKLIQLPANMTAISDEAFQGCKSLATVDFSLCLSSIRYIRESAFAGCTSLTVIDLLADSGCRVTSLGSYAFSNCTSLETVKLPHSIRSLDASVFEGCTSLKEFVISDKNTSLFVDNGVVFNSNSLLMYPAGKTDEEYVIPAKVGTKNITTVAKNAFAYNTHLTKVTISANVKTINQYAFLNCTSLITVVFAQDCAANCANDAFSGCSAIKEIIFGTNASPTVGNMFVGTQVTELTIPKQWTTLTNGMFSGMSKLTKVTFEEGSQIVELPYGLFANCTSITDIDLSNCTLVTTMNTQVFVGCTSLQTVTLPNNVTNIPGYTFDGCVSLTELYIPASVSSIESTAFNDCVSLAIIRVDPNNQHYEYDNGVLYSKGKATLIKYLFSNTATSFSVPESVTEIAYAAFMNNALLLNVTLPSNLITIQNNAFKGSSLVSVNIPTSVVEIRSNAFENCTNLSNLTFDKGGKDVLTIGAYVFQNCTSLKSVTLPARLRTKYDPNASSNVLMYSLGIGNYAFAGCTGLERVTFETDDSITFTDNMKYLTIGNYAFENCTSLTSVTLPDYVASYIPANNRWEYYGNAIGARSFIGCTSLSEFVILTDAPFSLDQGAFADCTALKELRLPSSLCWIHSYAFQNWTSEQVIYMMGIQQSQSSSWNSSWNGGNCNANIIWNA